MTKNDIYIEQALHGYSNGHRLLRSSIEFSENDFRKMMTLSDLSGNEVVAGFEKYYTGYKISNGKIVLACTWYANEMKRPGCVWTHSLIIDNKIEYSCIDKLKEILSLFRKPELNQDWSYYTETLKISKKEELYLDQEKSKYLIWCIWGNKNPLIIFDDNSETYENELIHIFLTQNDLLGEKFSFCTGSFSLREYDGEIIQLQITPDKISRSKMFIGKKAYEAKKQKIIKDYPMWVNKANESFLLDDFRDYREFRSGFSDEYKKASVFSSLMKFYIGSGANLKKTNLSKLLKMATVIFENYENLCNEILDLYRKKYFLKWIEKEDYIENIKFFINNSWLRLNISEIEEITIQGLNSDYDGSKILFDEMIKTDENLIIETILKTYAKRLPLSEFSSFTDLEYDKCSTLITLNCSFALCKEIWEKDIKYQQGIIRCLSPLNESIDNKIIEEILYKSSYDLATELYKKYGEKCFKVFWDYALKYKKGEKVEGIKKIVRTDIQNGVRKIKENISERDKLLFLVEIVDPYNNISKKITEEEIEKIYVSILSKQCSQQEKEVLAKFLLPFCLDENYTLSTQLAKFCFYEVNHLLATQTFPEYEWDKLEKILPEVAIYNSWDRCKRLRKGFKKKGYLFLKRNGEKLPNYLL